MGFSHLLSHGGLSQGELQAIRRLRADSSSTVAPTSTPSTLTPASSYFAHSGIPSSAFTASSSTPWIIDSGASDHMTGCSSVFDSYFTCSGKDKVRIADGSFSAISGKGSVRYSPSISLSSVLHIPKFATNLLSVSSFTRSANCSITFFPTHCVFQELDTGKVIGSGKAHGGIYYLENAPYPPQPSLSCGQALQADMRSSLSLLHQWHRRLGHPSFRILAKLFPSLIKYYSQSQFFCEAYELAKHECTFYALIN